MNRRRFVQLAVAAIALFAVRTAVAADAKGFSLDDKPGQYLDILLDGKIVARYMNGHDTSTKEKRLETYKPYLHVFDAEGKAPITQGAGGKQFPHHRGIYIGWQQMSYEGKKMNFWEMGSGDIVHEKFAETKADADSATFTSLTKWLPTGSNKPVIEETRTLVFHRGAAPARLVIDFTSTLKAPNGDVGLSANAEHGGVQYRPAGDITTSETVYTYPKANADPHKDRDYPWCGETYTLHGKKHSVVEMSSPENPKNIEWSAYRDYGRFGALPKAEIKSGQSLTLKFRFLIADGEMLPAEAIQKSYDQFAGATSPSKVPEVTVKKAEGAGKSPATKPATPKPAAAKPAAK
jgi:hypothetical protein